jgi:hypothetical protein
LRSQGWTLYKCLTVFAKFENNLVSTVH